MQQEVEDTRLRQIRHRVLVDENGRVLAVERLQSSGDPTLDANLLSTLSNGSFRPSKLDGVPVSAWVEIRGDDRLRDR